MPTSTDAQNAKKIKISAELRKIIARIEEIPTLPVISQQVASLLHDEGVSLKKIAVVIEKDMAMATNILKIANSPFYGAIGRISSIDHALAMMGLDEVRGILLAFSIHSFFSKPIKGGINQIQFWKHSIICSQIARRLATHFKIKEDGSIFLSGLIHDIGKVVFDRYFHDEFQEVTHSVSLQIGNFSQMEQEILGVTHTQVAAKMLRQWKLPQQVSMQVLYHHAPWKTAKYRQGAIIIYLANIFAKFVGYPSMREEKALHSEDFLGTKAMQFITVSGFKLDEKIINRLLQEIQENITADGWRSLSFLTGTAYMD